MGFSTDEIGETAPLQYGGSVGGLADKIERHLIENDMLRGTMSEREQLDLQ